MDPTSKAIELARQRSTGNLSDVTGAHGPSMHDGNQNDGRIPANSFWGRRVTTDTGLDHREIGGASMFEKASPEVQREQADIQLKNHVSTTTESNRIQLESDKEDLERKRRFNRLLFWGGMIFGTFALICFLTLIGVIVHTSLQNGAMEDTSIVSAIITAMVELMKIFGGG